MNHESIVNRLQTRGIGVGPNGLKMGPIAWGTYDTLSIAGAVSAECFVHAPRAFSERIHATDEIVRAQAYIRAAYRAGFAVPCRAFGKRNSDGTLSRRRCADCVPFRRSGPGGIL